MSFNKKKLIGLTGSTLFATAGLAQAGANAVANENSFAYTPSGGVSFGEQQLVTAEFGLAFDSKYMLYGVVDGKDPVVTPSAQVTFFDWLYFGSAAIFDVTRGNTQRVRSYMDTHPGSGRPLDHGGLMDTVFKGEFEWAVADCVSLKAYVAYYDFLLDANMRDGARSHNAAWGRGSHYNRSWNVVSGLALSVTF